eukprot:TRINITY_DN49336_c0_g1_i1.p1 TRINITY_DN49336_c0_g1~~TRINITY_DN49336_c0_g1_i1.p1  ORF type:complete len:932 (+),score=239.54 TRINITY_DN49336_c0_g1_i1:158-2953(+)
MSANPGAGPPQQTLLPEVEGRGGGRQGGRGPAPGSAWVKFRANQVLTGTVEGIFSAQGSRDLKTKVQDQESQAEAVENAARRCGDFTWQVEGAPPPDFYVLPDEIGNAFRAELVVFLLRPPARLLKEVRIRGPRRHTKEEARKDGNELRRSAFQWAQADPDMRGVLLRLKELEATEWRPQDLMPAEVAEETERQLPEFTTASEVEKKREQANEPQTLKEWIYEKREDITEEYQPSGPSWVKAGQVTATPRLPGIWYVHTRQQEDGKHASWLFFNANTGKYYRALGNAGTWVQTGVPHSPVQHPVKVAHAAVCIPAKGGRKDDLAVVLPELAKTGSVLKFPMPFLDKPSAMFLLVDGQRSSNIAAEFCAKRFHTYIMPRLSGRSTELEEHELVAIVNEAVEHLDNALLESSARYAGCGFALALLLGRRLLVSTLGDCRVLLCRAPEDKPKPNERAGAAKPWTNLRALAPGSRSQEVMEAVFRRLQQAGAPLDLDITGDLNCTSAASEALQALSTDAERLLTRAARAAHPFAALGLKSADLAAGPKAVHEAVQGFEAEAMPDKVAADKQAFAAKCYQRVREAAKVVMDLLAVDPFATQLLADLFYVLDEEGGIITQQRAAAALGVEAGCGEAAAREAIDRRYQALIAQLSMASREVADQGLSTLAEVAEVAAKKERFWTPEVRTVRVTRGMGYRDLKQPRRLVGTEVCTEVIKLEAGASSVSLLTDAARCVSDDVVAQAAATHRGRPRAFGLRVVEEASKSFPDEAVGAITMYFNVDDEVTGGIGADPSKPSDPKRRKVELEAAKASKEPGKAAKSRLAHILLKFQGSSDPDTGARRPAPKTRTQQEAERSLLEVLENLLKVDSKALGSRFAAIAREKSDCKSALNTPHADMGWVNPGQMGKEFDAAVADLQVGQLSDVVITPRGAHLIYRLA